VAGGGLALIFKFCSGDFFGLIDFDPKMSFLNYY